MSYCFPKSRIAVTLLLMLGVVNGMAETSASLNTRSDTNSSGAKVIALLGESIAEEGDADKKHVVDFVKLVSRLGGVPADFTAKQATLKDMVPTAPSAAGHNPTVAIIFTGRSDQKNKTPDNEQQDALTAIIEPLKNVGCRIYVVPSDAALGASVISNLRLACTKEGATFVEPGSETSGKPYEFAMSQIAEYESKGVPATVEHAKETAPRVTPIPEPALTAAPSTTGPAELLATRSTARIMPVTPEQLVSEPIALEKEEPTEPSSKETTKGKSNSPIQYVPGQKKVDVKMNSLPALKGFSPKDPVDRRNVDVKAPALAR